MSNAQPWNLREHPSAVLLAGQLAAVLAYPFLDGTVAGRAVLGVLGLVVVLAALWTVRSTPALTWFALLLGAPAAVFTVLEAVWPATDWVVLTSAALHAPFYLYLSYGLIRYLFADDRVTRDEVYATAAAFTVVAWGFAYLYSGVQVLWPGSFSGADGPAEQSWFNLLFLSFTTLTNTGLSDLTPALDHARSLAMLEEFAGVFYIAFVIARIVGLTLARRSADH